MTTLLKGDRAYALLQASRFHPIDCEAQKITEEAFKCQWRQVQLKPKPLIFIDPPLPRPGKLQPRKDYWILFTKEPTASWLTWASKYKVSIINCQDPKPELLKKHLTQGGFTEAGADAYIEFAGTNMSRLTIELDKFKLAGITRIDRQDVYDLVVGESNPTVQQVVWNLGTSKALEFARQIPENEAKKVFTIARSVYTGNQSGYVMALDLYERAFMEKRIDSYWTALQLFVHHCLREKKDATEAMLTTLELTTSLWITL